LIGTTVLAQGARQYHAFDLNKDGVVTRAEWRGALTEFRQRDWNSDGVLSGTEVWNDEWDHRDSSEFASLDRNGNGRITRGEWLGDRATFLRVDRNRDNQITRREYLNADATNASDRTDDFDALDVNLSERIERDEWTGTRPAFNRLDRNRDGRLTRREIAAGDVSRSSMDDSGGAVEHTVDVDAARQWTDTGIYINAGDTVTYRATGEIEMSGGNDRSTPAGALSGRRARNAPRPDQRAGTLLLRVGNSGVTAVGENGSFTARQSGQLSLGINDDHFADNSGQYRVWVAVDPR
jgi:Ca2+-binding EF-hand superfamily protein